MIPTETESKWSNIERIYDNMLTLAEINIPNRPCIQSFKHGRKISFLAIPTLEDLKSSFFESGDLVQEVGYPYKVTTMEDIISVAFLAQSPPGTLGHHDMISTVVSRIAEITEKHIRSFIQESISNGGTTKIFDADGLTEISLDGLLKKYY